MSKSRQDDVEVVRSPHTPPYAVNCEDLRASANRLSGMGQRTAGVEAVVSGLLHTLERLDRGVAAVALNDTLYQLSYAISPLGWRILTLARDLLAAIEEYEQTECANRDAFGFALHLFTKRRDLLPELDGQGIWLPVPSPAEEVSPTQGEEQPLKLNRGWGFHYLRTGLSAAWQREVSALQGGTLLGKAAHGLMKPESNGINRQEGALLARSMTNVLNPGDDVSDGAMVVGSMVNQGHVRSGHHGVEIERVGKPAKAKESSHPNRSMADSLAVMEELAGDEDTDLGLIRIDRITDTNGERAWQVYIPGGQGFDLSDVHSLLNSPNTVNAKVTPSAIMVTAAMKQAGVKKGENVVMVGHSHGGITASKLANDSQVRQHFDIPLVVAAGSPIDQHKIRSDTHVISLEHTEDFVPGLDGVAQGHKPGLTRVERTLTDSHDPKIAQGKGIHHTHDYPNYVDTAARADDSVEVARHSPTIEEIIPDGHVERFYYRGRIIDAP